MWFRVAELDGKGLSDGMHVIDWLRNHLDLIKDFS